MSSYIGRDEKKIAVPERKYLSRKHIIELYNTGFYIELELEEKAPIAFNFPSCRFKRMEMKKNPFLIAMEEKYTIKQQLSS